MKECNKTRIDKVARHTFGLIGLMVTIILVAGYLNGYSARLSTDLYGLLDHPVIFTWGYAYVVAFAIALWALAIDENGDDDE